ncbi:MAG TPA: S8 family serine peptidase [Acidimicrobiales bacterium]|nr:S8 family serine peptidase [Acidimicrobiales bacterium]
MRRPIAVLVLAVVATVAAAVPAPAAGDPGLDRQWGLERINAQAAWSVGRGAGTVIAIVDSGVQLDHEDLVDKLVPGFNAIDPAAPASDDCGHGTHVAGIAAASTGNGLGIAGVAPDAKIMPVKVLRYYPLEDSCGGSLDAVNRGIRHAADSGADVINLSLGGDTDAILGPKFTEAVRYAWSKGAILVVAAGNQFVLGSGFADEPAIVVTSTSKEDQASYFSNGTGQAKWAMAAPGGARSLNEPASSQILSTYLDRDDPSRRDVYGYLQGTSMAAPHVAGAAAVLRGLGLSPQETVDRLLATAEDLGSRSTYGAGRLDLAAAVAGLGEPEPAPAPPPEEPVAPASTPPTASPETSPPAEPTTAAEPTTEPAASNSADDTPTEPETAAGDPGEAPEVTVPDERGIDETESDEAILTTLDDEGGSGGQAAAGTVAALAAAMAAAGAWRQRHHLPRAHTR